MERRRLIQNVANGGTHATLFLPVGVKEGTISWPCFSVNARMAEVRKDHGFHQEKAVGLALIDRVGIR